MIASLRGVLQQSGEGEIILEVAGVGYLVSVPSTVLDSLPAIGSLVFLYTRQIVREDDISLYGFIDQEQREFFELLRQVSGVGPRIALAVLSQLTPDALRRAVGGDHPEILSSVPGIGRKTAEKMIFHLKDKLTIAPDVGREFPEIDGEVLSVLTALGYNLIEAQSAMQSIGDEAVDDIEERIRLALRYFAQP
jgi:holliday junction DNA helicase RuvA